MPAGTALHKKEAEDKASASEMLNLRVLLPSGVLDLCLRGCEAGDRYTEG